MTRLHETGNHLRFSPSKFCKNKKCFHEKPGPLNKIDITNNIRKYIGNVLNQRLIQKSLTILRLFSLQKSFSNIWPKKKVGSEDSFGRRIWALRALPGNAPNDAYYQTGKDCFYEAPSFKKLNSIHSIANTMICICHYLKTNPTYDFMTEGSGTWLTT